MTKNVFGLSGGKDSTCLLGWAIHESGYPRESLVFVFCDTENEYQEVYDQIDALDAYVLKFGCEPIVRLRGTGPWSQRYPQFPLFLALAAHKGRFPSAKARFCTHYLKIDPTRKFIASLITQGFEVVNHSGVRAAESIERSMLEEWGTDMFGCRTRRPLLKYQIQDVWEAHRKWRLPVNRLYLEGWKRVGCRLCIMSNKEDIRRTARKRPHVIDLYREWERLVGEERAKRGSMSCFSGWFSSNKVPEPFRSKAVNTKAGTMNVCTIDDAVEWSFTERGGKQRFFHEMLDLLDEEPFDLDDAHHPCQAGVCE